MLRYVKDTIWITEMEKDKKTMQYIKSSDKRKKNGRDSKNYLCLSKEVTSLVCLGVANTSIEIIKVEIKNYRIL